MPEQLLNLCDIHAGIKKERRCRCPQRNEACRWTLQTRSLPQAEPLAFSPVAAEGSCSNGYHYDAVGAYVAWVAATGGWVVSDEIPRRDYGIMDTGCCGERPCYLPTIIYDKGRYHIVNNAK